MNSEFHPINRDDKTISNLWTEYEPDFEVFYGNYAEDQKRYADIHGIVAKPDLPRNSCMVGMLHPETWMESKQDENTPKDETSLLRRFGA